MDFLTSNNIILIIVIALFIINFILLLILFKKINKVEQSQLKLNTILEEGNVEDYIIKCFDRQQKIDVSIKEVELEILKITEKQNKNFDQIGLIRYSASDDSQAKLSYSLGITNKAKDGFVITGLHYRQGVNIYVKSINGGVAEIPLSKEEQEALHY